MRILKCHNYYMHHGGEDAIYEDECALLTEHGHDVVQMTEHNHRADSIKLPSLALGTVWSFSSSRSFSRMLASTRPDVVHFHNLFFRFSPSVYQACRKAGVPVIQTLLNYRPLCPAATLFREGHVCEECLSVRHKIPGIQHGCYGKSHSKTAVIALMTNLQLDLAVRRSAVDFFLTSTEFIRQKYIQGGIPPESIVVKPNFVQSDPGKRNVDKGYMVFVGRLVPEKGTQTLIDAWRRCPGIPLKIVGDGPWYRQLKDADNPDIQLLGHVDRETCISVIREARCLVLPSEWYEAFPVAIVEAFACGVPVIASNLGTMAEVVTHGRTGLHIRAGSSEDLASQVLWAYEHPDEMKVLGNEARREFEERYSPGKNYDRLIEVYQMAIERNANRASHRITS